MENVLLALGVGIAVGTLAAIFWSIVHPERRIWPPDKYTLSTPILVWVPTLTLFGVLILLGIGAWGELPVPKWVRWGFGVSLLLLGNAVVWNEVSHFGLPQTGGAVGKLRTEGLYRFSRNPQYMADIAIVAGWTTLRVSVCTYFGGPFSPRASGGSTLGGTVASGKIRIRVRRLCAVC